MKTTMSPASIEEKPLISKKSKTILVSVVALICFFIFNPFVIVPSGSLGLVFNWGAIQEKTLEQGLHFRVPIMQKVQKVTVQPIQLDYTVTVDGDGAITKDNQTVGASITTYYQYDSAQLVTLYRDTGLTKMEGIITSAVKESFKEAIGDQTIFEVASMQEKIRGDVTVSIKEKLKAYPIVVTEFRVSNYDWSDKFDQQIQATMERAQQVKQAEQELLIQQQVSQKQVKEAEAAKQATVTKAEGARDAARLEAEAKALEGEGIRKYNDSIAANLEVQLRLTQLEIEKIKAERWDGRYVSVNNYGPIPVSTGSVLPK